jgi:acetyl-CoA acetyltransferase
MHTVVDSDTVAVVGVGRTPYTRERVTTRTPLSLAVAACRAALNDAGLPPSAVDGLVNFGMNDTATFGQVAHAMGIQDLSWNLDVYGGGFASYTSVVAAAAALRTGECTYALVFRSMTGRSGLRFGDEAGMAATFQHQDQEFDYPSGYVIPPQWFAMWATRHQFEHGTTSEDLGAVAITQRQHAILNPDAVMRKPMSLDDYLASPMVSTPLRIPDCSLEVDGAVAVLLTTLDRARDLQRAPVILQTATASYNAGGGFNDWPDFATMFSAPIAARFWERSGRSPDDIDVACIYDCFTYTVLTVMEDLGFYKPGEGGDFFRSGRATHGGDVVVNPHGGLLSEGYIHGFNHHLEAVLQLRGSAGERQVRDAQTALVTAGGGPSGGALLYTLEDAS